MSWSEEDRAHIAACGMSVDEVERQLDLCRQPPAPVELVRPCTPGDGIRVLSEEDLGRLLPASEEAARRGRLIKLVPASGAATRMFQSLLAARQSGAAADLQEARRRADAG